MPAPECGGRGEVGVGWPARGCGPGQGGCMMARSGRGPGRVALDLDAGPALRRGAARGRGVAPAARALVMAPLEQHLAAAADRPGGARGGGVGEVGVVLVVAVVAVVARGDPGRDGGGG